MATDDLAPLSREEFERKLRDKEKYYHINHEFHILMNTGKLDKEAIQGWVANRFYYQTAIPVKDAAIMSNCPDRDVRRLWVQRMARYSPRRWRRAAGRIGRTAPRAAVVARTAAARRPVRD